MDVFGPSVPLGPTVPPPAELIVNFGYLSVPLFYFFLGILSRILYRRFLQGGSEVLLNVYGVILPWLFMMQRGDFVYANLMGGYTAIVLAVVFWLATGSKAHRRSFMALARERQGAPLPIKG